MPHGPCRRHDLWADLRPLFRPRPCGSGVMIHTSCRSLGLVVQDELEVRLSCFFQDQVALFRDPMVPELVPQRLRTTAAQVLA